MRVSLPALGLTDLDPSGFYITTHADTTHLVHIRRLANQWVDWRREKYAVKLAASILADAAFRSLFIGWSIVSGPYSPCSFNGLDVTIGARLMGPAGNGRIKGIFSRDLVMTHCSLLLIRSFMKADPQMQPLHANILKRKTANPSDDRLNFSDAATTSHGLQSEADCSKHDEDTWSE